SSRRQSSGPSFLLKLRHFCPPFFQVLSRPVDLVKIDPIDLEPAQTVLAFATNGIGFQIAMNVPLIVPEKAAFRKDVRQRSGPAFERSRHNLFGVARPLHRCGVDPAHAQLPCPMNCNDGCLVILLAPAELPPGAATSPATKAHLPNVKI